MRCAWQRVGHYWERTVFWLPAASAIPSSDKSQSRKLGWPCPSAADSAASSQRPTAACAAALDGSAAAPRRARQTAARSWLAGSRARISSAPLSARKPVSIKGAASAAGDELRLGKANVKSELADSALSGIAAAEAGGGAAREQVDALMDKGRDLIDSAADLIRERPIASFGVAFAAGWIIAKLARSGGGDK